MVEYLIRGSDNQIKLTLTEDGTAISGAWTALDIHVGSVAIHRTADGDGVALSTSTGLLTLTPGDLTDSEQAALRALTDEFQNGAIVVTSTLNNDGVVFGRSGSDRLVFYICDKP